MSKISRRHFVEGTGVLAAALPLQAQQKKSKSKKNSPPPPGFSQTGPAPHTEISLTVNGVPKSVVVEDRWTLNEVLRDHLELTGTKLGCDRSECGACTVLIDGKAMYSCTQLAVWMDGKSIQTVEGLAKGGKLDPLQEAFIEHDAPQCGFCTSGQLMSAKALLDQNPHPTRDDVQHAMAGNICRCSNYNHYVEAVMAATDTLQAKGGKA